MLIPVTSDVKRIRFNVRTADIDTLMLVPGETVEDYPSTYIPYVHKLLFENGISLSNTMISEIGLITEQNPLYGKKISADGDSICFGNGYRGGYAKMIADGNSMQYQNIAEGGGTIIAETYSGETARHWICRSMQTIDTDADYILIEGGVNDSSMNVSLGAISNGYIATLDDTTFYGALETIFKTLTTKYVGKKYGFIIPHRMTAGLYPPGVYYKAVFDCAEKWGVSVLDLTKMVPPFNAFRSTTEYDTIRNAYTTAGDGWHPTELCYRQYYVPIIEAWMKTL